MLIVKKTTDKLDFFSYNQLLFKQGTSMRCYSFVNYYLSDIQRGIQSGHANVELSLLSKEKGYDMYVDWAKNHKTVVVLNGGNQASLQNIYTTLEDCAKGGMMMPFAKFHEDEQSLNGALTAVSIVVPEFYYETARKVRSNLVQTSDVLTYAWEFNVVSLLNSYSLA